MIVQIYEIQTPEEADKCIASGVDHIGSVISSEEEWRLPALKELIRVSREAGVKNSLIPLFHDRDVLFRVLEYYRPAYLHFCDSLTDHLGHPKAMDGVVDLQGQLKEKFPEIGLIRTIPIPGGGSASGEFPFREIASTLQFVSDFFLVDTWVEKAPVDGFVGITGLPADWEMAGELVLHSDIPVILAGGLSPENVYEALLSVLPAGADSCTQTNMVDGNGSPVRFKKDFQKVEKFANEVRRAEKAIRRKKEQLETKLKELDAERLEREAALPAHSIRPHQLLAIEDLEDEIAQIEKQLRQQFSH
jgi:phosphoribosylanthranilate isomerase